MKVLASIEAEIAAMPEDARSSWRAEVARTLATEMDSSPNASLARELRAAMNDLASEAPVEKGDLGDDLAARRSARIAASSGS